MIMERTKYRILLVDDEESMLLLLRRIAQDEGYKVRTAGDGQEAMNIGKSFQPHLIVTDLKMPVMDGMALLRGYKRVDADTDFIVLTAHGTVETAIQAMKAGALDYILKPLRGPDELRHVLRKAHERRRLLDQKLALETVLQQQEAPPLDIIFAGMEDILDDVRAVAATNATVLLTGETGTGKSLIARIIHDLSGRKGVCIAINCAAVPENLLESEFFGHEKGAFTGAEHCRKGKFELASEGTLLLDEVSEMGPPLQAKLLRVLQDGAFERLGGNTTMRSDARVICATNRDLRKRLAEGAFREDLYFRLNVFPILLRPLRERRGHIPALAKHIGGRVALRLGHPPPVIPPECLLRLTAYDWPGNVRELQNVLERALILSRGGKLDFRQLLFDENAGAEQGRQGTLEKAEREAIVNALRRTGGNRKKTAAMLGISLRALQYKIKAYGVGRHEANSAP
jgi:DNA-binding NtrC family response regulator